MEHAGTFLLIAIAAAYQVLVVVCPHPEEIESPFWRAVVSAMGRISLLRHQDSPRTLHIPFTRQPPPERHVTALPPSGALAQDMYRVYAEVAGEPGDLNGGSVSVRERGRWIAVAEYLRRRLAPLALLLLLVLAGACLAPQLAQRERDLAASLRASASVVNDFAAWDRAHQLELVRGSKTREEARAKLAAYRVSREQLLKLVKDHSLTIDAAIRALDLPDALPPPRRREE